MPRGRTWGYRGGWGAKIFFSEIQPDLVLVTYMNCICSSTIEPRHAKMCLREIDDVTRYDVLKSDVNISRIFQ